MRYIDNEGYKFLIYQPNSKKNFYYNSKVLEYFGVKPTFEVVQWYKLKKYRRVLSETMTEFLFINKDRLI